MAEREGSKRLTAAARRAQLIEVGRTVFAKRGYEASSVEEIAERAKISKPVVYEHFGGKEGLYAVIVDREMETVVRVVSEAISSGSPRERLERAALAFLTYIEENPDGFTVLARGSPVTTSGGEMWSLLNEVAARVGDIFAVEFKRAGYDRKAAPIYAHALVGMVTLVGQWWKETRKPSAEVVARHLVALAWMGLRRLPRRPALVTSPRKKREAAAEPGAPRQEHRRRSSDHPGNAGEDRTQTGTQTEQG